MRIVIAASVASAAGLAAAGVLGVASAEGPATTTTPQRTVSVQGVATQSIDQHSSAAAATATYHQGLADAVADGLGKAQLLAGKVGASLGPAQSVVEDGGFISCSSESGSAEYEGAQPDFGSPGISISSPSAGSTRPLGSVRGPSVRRRKRHRGPAAKTSATATCALSTQVSLVYPLS
jgi:hypothetical protein